MSSADHVDFKISSPIDSAMKISMMDIPMNPNYKLILLIYHVSKALIFRVGSCDTD